MNAKPYRPIPHAYPTYFEGSGVLGPSFPTLKTDTSYDDRWAYALSVIAGWSYAEGQVLADKLFFYGFPNCEVYELSVVNPALLIVATAYVVIDEKNGDAVLSFRGTVPTDLINWLTDADLAGYDFGPNSGVVHSGFFANVEALWSDVVDVIQTGIDDGRIRQLYITGHSLGAAMAVIAAARIYQNMSPTSPYQPWRDRIRGIYSFAQPWVGDAEFARVFDRRFGGFLYRFVFDDDVVPCLPPTSIETGFAQFGVRRFARTVADRWTVGGDDRRAALLSVLSVGASFVVRRIDDLAPLNRFFPFSLDDHSPRGYIEVCRNSVPGAPVRARPVGQAKKIVGQLQHVSANGAPPSPFASLRGRAPRTLVGDFQSALVSLPETIGSTFRRMTGAPRANDEA